MNIEEFATIMEPLFDQFTVYSAERKAKGYYRRMRDTNPMDLKRAVDMVCGRDDKFPSVARLGELIVLARQERARNEPSSVVACKWCNGNGLVSALDDKGHSYAYRCQCSNGIRYQRIPAWFGEKHFGQRLASMPDGLELVREYPTEYRKGLAYLDRIAAEHGGKPLRCYPTALKDKLRTIFSQQAQEVSEMPF